MSDRKIRFVITRNRQFPTKEQDRENLEERHDALYDVLDRYFDPEIGDDETKRELLTGFADLLSTIELRLHYLEFGPPQISPPS